MVILARVYSKSSYQWKCIDVNNFSTEKTRKQFFKSVTQALLDFNELNPIAPLQLLLEVQYSKFFFSNFNKKSTSFECKTFFFSKKLYFWVWKKSLIIIQRFRIEKKTFYNSFALIFFGVFLDEICLSSENFFFFEYDKEEDFWLFWDF